MKLLAFLTPFFSLFISAACFGQVYVDGIAIDTSTTTYCQLIGSNATLFSRATIVIDYGQRHLNTGLNRQKIAGPGKQPIIFNSTIDSLNFMAKQGWELVSSQVIGDKSGSESTFIYLLQRRKKNRETD